ncbi:MAG: dicarboxylate/amino acid:cation symporter [Candidatus Didemnitutus sp.]|nr:dicarboxylate/amino acid:cation symporter [Candidatus Didemnitutus sp.]
MRFLRHLYVQVLLAIGAGILLGHYQPTLGADLKPLGDVFIKLIKMLIGPIIFTTVVSGIGGMGNLKQVGRVGAKALLYFEAVTTLALIIGLVVANVFQPGSGVHATAASLDASAVAQYAKAAKEMSFVDWALHLVPNTFVSAFVEGEILQVLLISMLFGFALAKLGDKSRPLVDLLHEVSKAFFMMVNLVAKLAPIAAFGAMAFTVGKYGLGSLKSLAGLMACVYLTCIVFIVVVLGGIARASGFSLWKILKFIREELLIVIGTSSSEAGLPGLMTKMERAGCAPQVVGIVVPSGYSFNLDGTCIYLTMAALFIAQATDTPLDLVHQLGLLLVLLLTSKGAAGVTGSGFITLAATLSATGHVPVAGMALILGVDRFMSEARAITNFIGNTVATLIIAKWDRAFNADAEGARNVLRL